MKAADRITNAQYAFLADLGMGREVFAPNPSTLKALRKRCLVTARLIGMRWWWVQPTKYGIAARARVDAVRAGQAAMNPLDGRGSP